MDATPQDHHTDYPSTQTQPSQPIIPITFFCTHHPPYPSSYLLALHQDNASSNPIMSITPLPTHHPLNLLYLLYLLPLYQTPPFKPIKPTTTTPEHHPSKRSCLVPLSQTTLQTTCYAQPRHCFTYISNQFPPLQTLGRDTLQEHLTYFPHHTHHLKTFLQVQPSPPQTPPSKHIQLNP